tara:strand:- start:675 stop:1064 length:390 start_codon:yes stop_codon:yes gene_type:complete
VELLKKNNMAFRLPNQKITSSSRSRFNKDKSSVPGTPVLRKSLGENILGEANMDGSIYISDTIKPGSALEKKVLKHEMKHIKDIKLGKLAYDDNSVTHNGKKYERKNGQIKYNGKWMHEGSKGFPWEKH